MAHAHFVFDGAPLPSKSATAHQRDLVRDESRRQALQLLAQGDVKDSQYQSLFMKSFRKAPWLEKGIQSYFSSYQGGLRFRSCIYEADAQIAHHIRLGVAITQDQDLAMYGAFKSSVQAGLLQVAVCCR